MGRIHFGPSFYDPNLRRSEFTGKHADWLLEPQLSPDKSHDNHTMLPAN